MRLSSDVGRQLCRGRGGVEVKVGVCGRDKFVAARDLSEVSRDDARGR
jgi:hypothetical protein